MKLLPDFWCGFGVFFHNRETPGKVLLKPRNSRGDYLPTQSALELVLVFKIWPECILPSRVLGLRWPPLRILGCVVLGIVFSCCLGRWSRAEWGKTVYLVLLSRGETEEAAPASWRWLEERRCQGMGKYPPETVQPRFWSRFPPPAASPLAYNLSLDQLT